jgi:hypothetical protein
VAGKAHCLHVASAIHRVVYLECLVCLPCRLAPARLARP